MPQILALDRIGRNVINTFLHSKGSYNLLVGSVQRLGSLGLPTVRLVFYRQVYFTGVEALSRISIIAALIGIVIVTQASSLVGLNAVVTSRILAWTVVREIGPLLTAIIVIARSCTALAAELGAMKVNNEIGYIAVMGIDPMEYLVMPRIVGTTLCVFVLTFYFQIVAIVGGLALSSLLLDIPFLRQLGGIFSTVGIYEIAISLIKSLLFGLFISAASCHHGLRVKSSITEIPQATTAAVMQSLFVVFILDGLVTVASFI